MIETRKLTRAEFNKLINEAPESEVRNLRELLGVGAYDYFEEKGMGHFGIITDRRPIYMAVLVRNNGAYDLWTVVNSGVKEQFSLYKYSKKQVYNWLRDYNPIYATMEKGNEKNIKWTSRLGFKKIFEDDNIITFCLQGG